MILAEKDVSHWHFNRHNIELEHYPHNIFIVIRDSKGEPVYSSKRLDVSFETEEAAILFAQRQIEDLMLDKMSREELEDAINKSLKKWRDVLKMVHGKASLRDIINESHEPCGFCEYTFTSCSKCPVRVECRKFAGRMSDIQDELTEIDHQVSYEEREEYRVRFKVIAETVVEFLKSLKANHLNKLPKFKKHDLLQSEYSGDLHEVKELEDRHYEMINLETGQEITTTFRSGNSIFVKVGELKYSH